MTLILNENDKKNVATACLRKRQSDSFPVSFKTITFHTQNLQSTVYHGDYKGKLHDQPQKTRKQTFPPALSQTTPKFLGQFACKIKKLNKKEIHSK